MFKHPTWAGGVDGAPVPPPRLFGIGFGPNDSGSLDGKLPNPWFGILCLAVVALLGLLVANLRRSATGRHMLSVRANERAAAAAGVNVAGTKLLAFAIAAFIAGIGGALSGYRFGAVSPVFFGSLASLLFLAFAYLGGISSVTGAVVGGCLVAGGVAFTALDEWFGVEPSVVTRCSERARTGRAQRCSIPTGSRARSRRTDPCAPAPATLASNAGAALPVALAADAVEA